jgi:hypothetical protein
LADYPQAWNLCGRMIKTAKTIDRTGPLSNQDFGPIPILIATVGGVEIHAFAHDSVGAMASQGKEPGTFNPTTLSSQLNENCRPQAWVAAMKIHVTTSRYQLIGIEDFFGASLESAERRFASWTRYQIAERCEQLMNRAK